MLDVAATLDVAGIDVFYGDLQALWQVSIRVEPREVVALLGPNGAGKSTLLRTIAGLRRPASGTVTFDGRPLHREPAHRIVEHGVALVPEGRRLFSGMSVLENLLLGAFTPRARAEREQTQQWIFDMFPVLAERRHQVAGTLSGGEQQMLAVGRALMGRPTILLLDEPSLGLAPLAARRIFAVIKQINAQGVTVLLVEQNVRSALDLAQRAYLLEGGRITGAGTSQELLRDARVQSAFLDYFSAR
jgi:branched-chain amino acid transport system ATP-binding protein